MSESTRRGRTCALLLFGLPIGGAGAAPNAPEARDERILFEEIPSVYGASRFEQRVSEAPASVTVITAEDIARFGWWTLADVLRNVRGLFTTYDRNYTYVAVRGFGRPGDYNTGILLLLDGNRVNDNVYHGAYYGTESLVDLAVVDRIEVIRGPASSLYGTSAFFGVVNVITKRGRDYEGGEVEGVAASHGTGSVGLRWGERRASGLETLVSTSLLGSRGQDLWFEEFVGIGPEGGLVRGRDGDARANAFVKLGYRPWSISAAVNRREKEIPTASYGTLFADRREETVDRTAAVRVGWSDRLPDDSSLDAFLSWNDYAYEGAYPYEGSLYVDHGKGTWWTLFGQNTRRFGKIHTLIVGAQFDWNVRQDQGGADLDPYVLYLDDRRSSSSWGLFVQDELRPSEDWIVSAGIRYDRYGSFGGTTNPRIAVIWGGDRAATVKVLYGRAFRAPNVYELHYFDPDVNQANPDLEPERISTWETTLEGRIGGSARGVLSVYRFQVDDLIRQTADPSDGSLGFANVDRVRGEGLEAALEWTWRDRIDARVGWSWQRTQDRTTGARITNSPASFGYVNLALPLAPERVILAVEARTIGDRVTVRGPVAPGHTVVDLHVLARRLANRLELSAGVRNVLDRRYGDPAGEELVQASVPQDGRTFRVALRFGF